MMRKPRILYDVGDFDYLRYRLGSLNSDKADLEHQERIARLPFFDFLGALGGWDLKYTITNGLSIILLATLPAFWPILATVSFYIFLKKYVPPNRARISLINRDIVNYLRTIPDERPTVIARIIANHQEYFARATQAPRPTGMFFRHIRLVNSLERVTARLPTLLYSSGMGSLIVFVLTKAPVLATLAIDLIVIAVPALPLSIAFSVFADDERRKIPPILHHEDVKIATGETQREDQEASGD